MTGVIIAVDGPSGVGKSTVCRGVADRLGLSYLDTGATYRLAALHCLREGIDFDREDDVLAAVETMNAGVGLDPKNPTFSLENEDVSRLIRSDAVTGVVSRVAINLKARAALGRLQRDLIAQEVSGGQSGGAGIVAEGRDVTTVIAPDADVRVLLTADPEVRVARRALETGTTDSAHARESVLGRDSRDAIGVDFHTAADGVTAIDTTDLKVEEVVSAIVDLVHRSAS